MLLRFSAVLQGFGEVRSLKRCVFSTCRSPCGLEFDRCPRESCQGQRYSPSGMGKGMGKKGGKGMMGSGMYGNGMGGMGGMGPDLRF